jgi:hypothetical protein
MAAAVAVPIGSGPQCMDQVAICVSPLHVRPAQEQTRAQTMCTKNVVPVPIRVHTWKGYTRLLFLGVIMF